MFRSSAEEAAGVDISEEGVRGVLLKKRGGGWELESHFSLAVPSGTVAGSRLKAPEKFVEILRTLRLKMRLRSAYASFSERNVRRFEMLVPPGTKNIRARIEFDLPELLPMSGDFDVDFGNIREDARGTVVSVAAFPRRIVSDYRSLFQKAGIALLGAEPEGNALVRASLSKGVRARSLVFDYGKHESRLAFFENGAVSSGLSFGPRDVAAAKDELLKFLKDTPKPERFLLSGANASVPGLAEYLEGELGAPVSLARVWQNAFSFDAYVPPMPLSESFEYAGAIGLALRGI